MPTIGYRPEIDGLRALAVALVVFFHAAPSVATGGFIGVDIFFVISGYLITGIIARSLDAGNFSLRHFYARRCRRILPALWAMMAAVWLLGWVVLLPGEFSALGLQLLAGLGFGENILMQRTAGYFDGAAIGKPLMHLWSLAVEEQFYLLWPLALMLACRWRLNRRWLVLAVMAASLAYGFYQTGNDSVAAFYLLPSRFWEILLGGALACFPCRRLPVSADALALLAVVVIIGFAFLLNQDLIFAGWAIAPCVAAACLLAVGQGAWINRVLMSASPMVWLGRISYPLYLWHWPLLSLAHITGGESPPLGIRLGAVVLSVLLAWATYRLVERPVRFPSAPQPRAGYAAVAAALALAALGYAAWARPEALHMPSSWASYQPVTQGMDKASLVRFLDSNDWLKSGEVSDAACRKSAWMHIGGDSPVEYCRLTAAAPQLAIIGDSHANHLLPGLAALGDPVFSHAVEMGYGGCVAFDGVQVYYATQPRQRVQDCMRASMAYVQKIRQEAGIRWVVFSLFLHPNEEYGAGKGLLVHSQSPDEERLPPLERLREGLSRSIAALEQSGKRVLFVIDVPDMGFDPHSCLDVRPFSLATHRRRLCVRPLSEVMQEQSQARRMLAQLAARHPAMVFFDPVPAMCDADYCYAMREGKILYRDANHLSLDGSVIVGKALVKAMQALPSPP